MSHSEEKGCHNRTGSLPNEVCYDNLSKSSNFDSDENSSAKAGQEQKWNHQYDRRINKYAFAQKHHHKARILSNQVKMPNIYRANVRSLADNSLLNQSSGRKDRTLESDDDNFLKQTPPCSNYQAARLGPEVYYQQRISYDVYSSLKRMENAIESEIRSSLSTLNMASISQDNNLSPEIEKQYDLAQRLGNHRPKMNINRLKLDSSLCHRKPYAGSAFNSRKSSLSRHNKNILSMLKDNEIPSKLSLNQKKGNYGKKLLNLRVPDRRVEPVL